MGCFYVEIEGLSSRELFLIRVLTIFNVEAQVPPLQHREQKILENQHFPPVFLIAAVRAFLQPVPFLNSLERYIWNIALPLSLVLGKDL